MVRRAIVRHTHNLLSLSSLWSKLVCQFTNVIYVPSLIRSRSCSRSGWRYRPGQTVCTYHTTLPRLSIARSTEGAQPTITLKQFRRRARALRSEYGIRRSHRSLPHPGQTSKWERRTEKMDNKYLLNSAQQVIKGYKASADGLIKALTAADIVVITAGSRSKSPWLWHQSKVLLFNSPFSHVSRRVHEPKCFSRAHRKHRWPIDRLVRQGLPKGSHNDCLKPSQRSRSIRSQDPEISQRI